MIDGHYYDLSSFDHPGGNLIINQSRGEDVTAAFYSHHFTDTSIKVLNNYYIDPENISGAISQTNYSFEPNGFYMTLKNRVLNHLGGAGKKGIRKPPTIMYTLWVYSVILLYILSWVYNCTHPLYWPSLACCAISRMVLTGIGHEAIHGRLQHQLWYLFDAMLLFPSDFWHYEHCLAHHPHCKRYDLDPDETLLILRMNHLTQYSPWLHPLQLVLQLVASFFVGIAMYIEHHVICNKDLLMATFTIFITQFVCVFTHPMGYVDGLWVHFYVVCLSNALTLHAFHLSHINYENSAVKYEYRDGVDWGEHQVRTTSNWKAWQWLSVTGMLELQIEHHLFPSLTYAQQNDISGIVKQTAAEFGLPYHEYPSMFHGIFGHLYFMQWLGLGVMEPVEKIKSWRDNNYDIHYRGKH
eukprot:Mrub_03939.p1 GENE.Mrub_03939~~Mrub_03939.p1  ORF type:complete len:431 (+),score=35.68 Mrub_03939:66-1295(+)